jgi:CheY-like chemotaxis protein
VSLRILFADDSMTAQNMGKKILSEAGYDVVAVSNGAAAVKKIAEQKPDIIILDVYMPGYSGLEVCEKVRGSLDTLKTPVLLTVGKMEPYKPEDANRVKADGVIIKPFEASDLLAIIKKFEERIGSAPPPPLAKPAPVVETGYQDEETVSAASAPAEAQASSKPSGQSMVEVPDHMAGSAAFGDLLSSEPPPTSHFAVNTPSAAFETSVIVPAPPVITEPAFSVAVSEPAPAASEEIPIAMEEAAAGVQHEVRQEEPIVAAAATPAGPVPEAVMPEIDATPDVTVTPVEAAPEVVSAPEQPRAEAPAIEPPVEAAAMEPPSAVSTEAAVTEPEAESVAEPPHPQFIPVFKDPVPEPAPAQDYAFMPTSAPPVEVEIQREPALQETAEETTRSTRVDHVEPGLLSTIGQQVHSFDDVPAQQLVAAAAQVEASQQGAPEAFEVSPSSAPAAADSMSDADFEARVAAAMAAYNSAEAVAEPAAAAAVEPQRPATEPEKPAEQGGSLAATDVYEVPEIETAEAAHDAIAGIPAFEYQLPVRTEAVTAEPALAQTQFTAAESSPAAEAVAAEVEIAVPAAAAAAVAADAGSDHHTIAQAVHRVMERLKPELVEEIMRELRSKK